MKKVAVIGTVGVPANYGGFETLVENLLDYQSNSNIDYTIYCSAKRYQEKLTSYKGAHLKYLPLDANGMQAFLYDSWSILRAIKNNDVILSLGAAGALAMPIAKLFGKRIVVNIDGVDTKRAKFNPTIRKILDFIRRTAVRFADTVVSDNEGIRKYVKEAYGCDSKVIEYGGDNAFPVTDEGQIFKNYGLNPKEYNFKVARIEAENNIEMILDAFAKMPCEKMVIVGNWNKSPFGIQMRDKFKKYPNLLLLDPIYDSTRLNLLRSNCKYYIHGHSVGGTNPSLVEAMNLSLPIIAYDCIFNRETTEHKALYFDSPERLIQIVSDLNHDQEKKTGISKDMHEIAMRRYQWAIIAKKYEDLYEL